MDLANTNYERRSTPISALELRNDGDKTVIEGLVVPFGQRSEDMGFFTEEFRGITPDPENVFALWAHDVRDPLGSTREGALSLKVETRGLVMRLEKPVISAERMEMLRRGILPNASFGFVDATAEWVEEEGKEHRVIHDAKLIEVSVGVAFPAYKQTDIKAAQRSLEAAREERWRVDQQLMEMEARVRTA